jgi:hypothetical protein
VLYWIQSELFPHRFGGTGILNQVIRLVLHGWEDVKGLIIRRKEFPADLPAGSTKDPGAR